MFLYTHLYTDTNLILMAPYKVGVTILPVLQIRKPRHGKAKKSRQRGLSIRACCTKNIHAADSIGSGPFQPQGFLEKGNSRDVDYPKKI